MQLAYQAAQRYNHEYIGTEHILLGLINEGTGVAANVLNNLGIELRRIRIAVENLLQPGPDLVTIGRLPMTPTAKKVIEYAIEEARYLKHNHVGSEHVLLGLLRKQDSIADRELTSLGLKPEDVREEILAIVGLGNHPIHSHWLAWNGGTVAMLARGIKESYRWQDLPVLADALEDAGCADPEILGHCRSPGKHVRRCWVVEMLVRKP
jgi:ATP-dependent Clp protease ATP-binding subunit ClpC